MSRLPFVGAEDVVRLVPMLDAIDCLRQTFAGRPSHAERLSLNAEGGDFLVMPAALGRFAGAKLVMVQPANAGTGRPIIDGTYVLFDALEGRAIASFDGAALTALRTPAVSMLAAQALTAKPQSAVVIGLGPQGEAHFKAVRTCFPGMASLVQLGRGQVVPAADLIIAATSTRDPILSARMISPGTHVTLVGSYRPDRQEATTDLINASTVYVDERAAARREAGDLISAPQTGKWDWDRVAGDLCDLASGRERRLSVDEITIFKSVGLAVQDLAVAGLAAQRAGLVP